MIGTNLDKYEVRQKVGEGGMATVYLGRDQTLDRDVAIKVLHPHLSSSARNRKRFEREAKAIAHLDHENVLRILHYSGLTGHDCYIVTEFVEGETLSTLLQARGRIPSEVAAMLGIDLCHALDYAHNQGVLHRDVKPDNVMLRVDGTLKLMDFGIARFLDETRVTMTGALVGSPAFMSPEQAREGPLDARTDLFSLGTVLYNLVTGTLPFTGSNPSLILKNVIEGNRPSVNELAPTVSPTLGDLVERLMATDPSDRPSTAREVAEELERSLAEVQLRAAQPPFLLVDWMREPVAFEQRLAAHVESTLLVEGKRRLAEGDQLGALRQFNRLLSMREDHPEVLALVQNLHGDAHVSGSPAGHRRRNWLLGAASAFVVLLAITGLGWMAYTAVPAGDPPQTSDPAPPTLAASNRAPEAPEPTQALAAPVIAAPAPAPVPLAVARPPPTRVVAPPSPFPAPAPPPAPIDDGYATVRLNTHEYVADVYLRDRKLGTSREAVLLPAGTYRLMLKQRLLQDHEVEVTVASGEERVVDVSLHPRPSRVSFPRTWSSDCVVRTNGIDAGTLATLGHRLEVPNPNEPLEVALECPGHPPTHHRYTTVVLPGVVFPGP